METHDELEERISTLAQYKMLGLSPDTPLHNPFANMTRDNLDDFAKYVLSLMRKPEYFYFTCKYVLNIRLMPFQCVILQEMWRHPFPMLIGSRGMGKSFILGLYAILRAVFIQGRKVVITGSGFRQAKTVFNYAENIWNNAPVLRSLMAENPNSGSSHQADRWTLRLGDSTITALPLGDGTKIRGERAHDIIADEFASIPRETFETVVRGFGVVNLDPVSQVEREFRKEAMKEMGMWSEAMSEHDRKTKLGNQTIISGTAFYQFNHFCEYWQKHVKTINSEGDPKKLAEAFNGEVQEGLDWRDNVVIRFPYDMLPVGYMDAKQVAQSQAQVHSGTFNNEFGAIFSSDSNGFFRRLLIEGCVTTHSIIIGGEEVRFLATITGNPHRRYVYGIDPASEHDRFSIMIIEVHDTHRRIVHGWTTTRQEYQNRLKNNPTLDKDFYGFCARKIRALMKSFPCEHIALDSQGGGIAVREALHDPDKMEAGEIPIWEINPFHPLSDGKVRSSDDMSGLHILEMVNFAKAEWVAEANHGMRKDFEDKTLLFPAYDAAILAVISEEDVKNGRIYDTLDDATYEIEQCKEELATIVHTQTPGTNRDKWDTPEVKLPGAKKGRLRKDRYSALLMANAAARKLARLPDQPEMVPYGGFVGRMKNKDVDNAPMYYGPDWFTNPQGGRLLGISVTRNGVD